jgi:hypothetical protein
MFTTPIEVNEITGKTVDAALIQRAQYAIEAYIGKFDSEVTNENDRIVLNRATAYQAAYMLNNEDIVFEQIAVSTTTQNDSSTTFKSGDTVSPFIAPMAVMMCSKLSFVKSRSIKTGKIRPTITYPDWLTI